MISRTKLILVTGLLFLATLAVAWHLYPTVTVDPAKAALAEYRIEKMTCGSCVRTIEEALAALDGVGSVEINVSGQRGRVVYDPERVDSARIAETISATGYPASLRLNLDPREYAALQQEQTQLGQQYLARIGDRLLARDAFEAQVRQRAAEGATREQLELARRATWQEVMQRELLLADAERNQVVVQDGEVNARLEEMKGGHQGFESLIAARFGSVETFRERLREDLIINRNIEDHVTAGIDDAMQKKARLQDWFADLQQNTEVIIFDPSLKPAAQGGSGAAGCACCNG